MTEKGKRILGKGNGGMKVLGAWQILETVSSWISQRPGKGMGMGVSRAAEVDGGQITGCVNQSKELKLCPLGNNCCW